MKGIRNFCVLSWIGVFACVGQTTGPAPAGEVEVIEHAVVDDFLASEVHAPEAADSTRTVESNLFWCCKEYVCPETGAEYLGCTGSSPTPTQAASRCNAACGPTCQLVLWECN